MIAVEKGQTVTVDALVEGDADVHIQQNVSPADESYLWSVHCMSIRRALAMDMHV